MSVDLQMTYLDFVVERHRVWLERQQGFPPPWSDDPILASKKFTNVFRLLDHGSQFLLGMLQEDFPPRELLARAFLYRHTGRPEPWEFFELMHGRYPLLEDLTNGALLETWRTYRGDFVSGSDRGNRSSYQRLVFTPAYLVYPQTTMKSSDKLEQITLLAKRLFVESSVWQQFLEATTQAQRFGTLRKNLGVGDFMSMQILTDYGYTTEDRENEFVVAGPGAVRGAKLLFPDSTALQVIHWAHAYLQTLDVQLPNGRRPSLMDVQNTLCEFSKYHRYLSKPPGQPYRPAHPGPQPALLLPLLW